MPISRREDQQNDRLLAVKMLKKNVSVEQVAAVFDTTVRSVQRWRKAFKDFGEEGLVARQGAGRPSKVSPTQMSWVAMTVKDDTPADWDLGVKLWTLPHIKKVIERGLGLSLCLPTVRKIMKNIGFTPQRPLRRAYEQDPALVEKWLKVELPALRQRAKDKGARLMFGDEASMRPDYHAGTTWAPQGKTPIVKTSGNYHKTVNMISAVGTTGEFQFMLVDGPGNSYSFKEFLERLLHDSQTPVFLVVDNHNSHKSALIKEYVKSTKGKLELHYIPPYAPQLNPDEQVWKNIKGQVSKKCPSDEFEMRGYLREALESLKEMPEVVKGFFRHPDCGFAT